MTDSEVPELFSQVRHAKKRAVLAAYARTGRLAHSCRSAKMHHSVHYYWLKTDPLYVEAFAEAQQMAIHALEEEAVRRAREGVTRAVYYKGEKVGEEQEYSDTLLIFLLKVLKPETYRERFEHTGANGAPLQIVLTRRAGGVQET
jgi:hypothetical protein